MVGNGVVGQLAIMGAICRDLTSQRVNLVKQRLHLRGVAGILIRHDVRDDIAAVGIECQVQFAPTPAGLTPCFSASHWPAP